ncbi:glycoside hydrolase [Candidatus Poribacteria bacterium]|nr:glycoside hydrolase [Candidatus Poribacteria bacterium]
MQRFNDGRDWFFERRFGLFIHWGLYAIPGWHEQIQWRKPISKAEYIKLQAQFNPTKFDPDAWLDIAEAAGMQYLCITTKHHDGFCLWDTKYTNYNVMNTPYNKDILKMLADACHKRNFGLCLYYSIPDWNHPNSINLGGDHQLPEPNPGDEPDEDKYIEYVKNQVRELCTNYGKIWGFFWDIPPQRHDPSLNEMLRSLQPGIMINDRGYDKGDYDTPERKVPEGKRFSRPTKACQSIGRQSWGYREDEDYYSHKFLMQSIDRIMAMGGNYLLNVGPKADGTFPNKAIEILGSVGKWFCKVRESLVEAEPASGILDREDFMLTRNRNNLYVHFHKDPEASGVLMNPLKIAPKKATLLNTGRDVKADVEVVPTMSVPPNRKGPCLRISGLPVNELVNEIMVVKLEFHNLDEVVENAVGREKMEEYRF